VIRTARGAHWSRLARTHYENFPVGRFIPRSQREAVRAVYAFARLADDIADEGRLTEEKRLRQLAEWADELERCLTGQARSPLFQALGEVIHRYELSPGPFRDLLTAFRMDVEVKRYRTFSDLLQYCRYSANPVGRLVLALFGHREPDLIPPADAISTALQLTNHWQDLALDLDRDRIYLPLEDLEAFGYTIEELCARRYTPAYRQLMAFQVERTRVLFESGRPLLAAVSPSLRFELRLTWLGGQRILDQLTKSDYDVFRRRPRLTGLDRLRLLLATLHPIPALENGV